MKSSAALAMDGFAYLSSPPLSHTQRPLALSAMMEMTAVVVVQPLDLATSGEWFPVNSFRDTHWGRQQLPLSRWLLPL